MTSNELNENQLNPVVSPLPTSPSCPTTCPALRIIRQHPIVMSLLAAVVAGLMICGVAYLIQRAGPARSGLTSDMHTSSIRHGNNTPTNKNQAAATLARVADSTTSLRNSKGQNANPRAQKKMSGERTSQQTSPVAHPPSAIREDDSSGAAPIAVRKPTREQKRVTFNDDPWDSPIDLDGLPSEE